MTWKNQTICRILIIIAKILAEDNEELKKELVSLCNHISYGDRTK